jgi:hypothetical protein
MGYAGNAALFDTIRESAKAAGVIRHGAGADAFVLFNRF